MGQVPKGLRRRDQLLQHPLRSLAHHCRRSEMVSRLRDCEDGRQSFGRHEPQMAKAEGRSVKSSYSLTRCFAPVVAADLRSGKLQKEQHGANELTSPKIGE